jgi:hypothetical protein
VAGRYEQGAKPQGRDSRKQGNPARRETTVLRTRMFAVSHFVVSIFKI